MKAAMRAMKAADLGGRATEGGETADRSASSRVPRVVIVGAGFGGLTAAIALADAPVQVTIVDSRNYDPVFFGINAMQPYYSVGVRVLM